MMVSVSRPDRARATVPSAVIGERTLRIGGLLGVGAKMEISIVRMGGWLSGCVDACPWRFESPSNCPTSAPRSDAEASLRGGIRNSRTLAIAWRFAELLRQELLPKAETAKRARLAGARPRAREPRNAMALRKQFMDPPADRFITQRNGPLQQRLPDRHREDAVMSKPTENEGTVGFLACQRQIGKQANVVAPSSSLKGSEQKLFLEECSTEEDDAYA